MQELPVIRRVLDYIDGQRNFSAHTIRSYANDLRQFCQFLVAAAGGDVPAGKITTDDLPPADQLPLKRLSGLILTVKHADVRGYLAMLRNCQSAKSTIARKLATLRSFKKFMVRIKAVSASPVSAVRTPRQDQHLPK